MRSWIRFIATIIASMSITLSWPEWICLVLLILAVLIWGITGYMDGIDDGMNIK